MQPDRRDFLKHLGMISTTGFLAARPASAADHGGSPSTQDSAAVLVDLTVCVGCRLCEHACKKSNGFDPGPVESYDDQSVFRQQRRPAPDAYTVVNAFPNTKDPAGAVYVKSNCFHCDRPACVSACIVGALRKTESGPVTYDAWKCIGCRYCMVACPFQIPAYDYHDALTPQVRKCQFCHERQKRGLLPACVEACPRQAMITGRRAELLLLARERIAKTPGAYVDRIYGEHEVGGTSWLYLSAVPFEEIGFLKLPDKAPSQTTEAIQHGVFKYGLPPLGLYGLLGGLMFVTRPRSAAVQAGRADEPAGSAPAAHDEDAMASGEPGELPQMEEVLDTIATAPPQRGARRHHPPETCSTEAADHHDHHEPMPVGRKLLTPGVLVVFALALTGLVYGVKRFLFGLGAATNLDQQYPWGLWIGVDVASGVALAAGGFTTAFLAHVLHRERYHAIVRPALLTAMLGYTFVVLGLQADLGRYYNVWHPLFMWQGNSVLFEVGMCVMCYLNVLYLEFAPIVCERLAAQGRFPRLRRLAEYATAKLERVMSLLIIAGCVLSCLHQSSLGCLMVIAPSKLHPLWWTPILPLQFLMSAIAVGFPMVIFESLVAGKALKLQPEMDILGPLARFIPFTLGAYLAVKIGDMVWRGTYAHLTELSLESACWLVELTAGVVIPLLMLLNRRVRRSPRLLLLAAGLVVAGVVLNRVNVFIIGYTPPYATQRYVPSIDEFAVKIGLIATLVICYRLIVTWFGVISQPKAKATA